MSTPDIRHPCPRRSSPFPRPACFQRNLHISPGLSHPRLYLLEKTVAEAWKLEDAFFNQERLALQFDRLDRPTAPNTPVKSSVASSWARTIKPRPSPRLPR